MVELFFLTILVVLIIGFVIRQTSKDTNNTSSPHKNQYHKKSKSPEYTQIIKSSSSNDNMNCDLYNFSGKFSETKRMRKNHTIHIFENENVKDAIIRLGYEEPIEFEKIDFKRPSEAQADYLYDLAHGVVPDNVSFDDASALISRYVEHDRIANPHLFRYATEMHIPVSYYCGKKQLYNLIFGGLELRDQIAFFVFCVYRDAYDSRGSHQIANLNNSPYKHFFYEFANCNKDNSSFIKSMHKYAGQELRFFGEHTFNGYVTTGGSKNTIAYKTAKEFLKTREEYI